MDKRTLIGLTAMVVALVAAWLFWPERPPEPMAPPAAAELPSPPAGSAPAPAPAAATIPEPTPPAGVAPVRGGVLAGRVVDESGRSAGGANVYLKIADIDVRPDIADGAYYILENRSTEANGEGGFSFLVSPGRYELFAKTQRGSSESWTAVDVPSGARREVLLRLKTGLAVRGRVVDPAGAAIQGAQINVGEAVTLDARLTKYPHWKTPSALSGVDGRWEVSGLVLGPTGLRIHARHPEHADGLTELPGPPPDEVLMVLGPRVAGSGGRLTGRVTDQGGRPLKGVRVAVQTLSRATPREKPRPGETWWDLTQRTGQPVFGYETATGEDGRFDLDKVPAGKKRVIFEIDGKRPSATSGIELHDGDVVPGVDSVMEGGLSIRGRITDDTGRPLPGALVSCVAADYREQEVQAGPGGSFVLEGLPEGPARLQGEMEGHAVIRVQSVAGESGVVIAIPRTGAISGTVRQGGRPADIFDLVVERIQGPVPDDLAAKVEERRFGDRAAGLFRYERIDPGTYRFTARVGEATSPPATVVINPGQPVTVALDIP